jgi:hypothetical protein
MVDRQEALRFPAVPLRYETILITRPKTRRTMTPIPSPIDRPMRIPMIAFVSSSLICRVKTSAAYLANTPARIMASRMPVTSIRIFGNFVDRDIYLTFFMA